MALARFRILRIGLGIMLAVHFVRRSIELSGYLDRGGLFDARLIEPIAGRGLPWGQILPKLPELAQTAWFGAAALLSLTLALGPYQRVRAAVLLALSVETYWATYPATVLDDQMVNLTLIWLALVPLDTGPGPDPSASAHGAPGAVAAAVLGAQLAVLLVFFMVIPEKRVVHGPFYPMLLLLTTAGLLAPWNWARIAALVPAAAAHLLFYAETRMAFTSAVLFACTALFSLPHRCQPRTHGASGLGHQSLRLEWGETVGACLLIVYLLGAASSAAGWTLPWHATRRLLCDLGLAPPAARLLASGEIRAARVETELANGEKRRVLELDVENPRQRTLIQLSATNEFAALSTLKQQLAERHAIAFCRHFSGYAGSAELVVDTAHSETRELAWLSCPESQRAEPTVVLLEAAPEPQQTP